MQEIWGRWLRERVAGSSLGEKGEGAASPPGQTGRVEVPVSHLSQGATSTGESVRRGPW